MSTDTSRGPDVSDIINVEAQIRGWALVSDDQTRYIVPGKALRDRLMSKPAGGAYVYAGNGVWCADQCEPYAGNAYEEWCAKYPCLGKDDPRFERVAKLLGANPDTLVC